MKRFAGKVVIVTGGGSGIGEATVRRFSAEDASVVVADIRRPAVDRVMADIDPERHLGLELDVLIPASIDNIFGRRSIGSAESTPSSTTPAWARLAA